MGSFSLGEWSGHDRSGDDSGVDEFGGRVRGRDVTISVCPDGPLLVRGPADLRDGDGNPIERRRDTIALCRCGGTSIAPFCDGTHKKRRRGWSRARG